MSRTLPSRLVALPLRRAWNPRSFPEPGVDVDGVRGSQLGASGAGGRLGGLWAWALGSQQEPGAVETTWGVGTLTELREPERVTRTLPEASGQAWSQAGA